MNLLRAVLFELIKNFMIIYLTDRWVKFDNLDSVSTYLETINEIKNNLELYSHYEMIGSIWFCLLIYGRFIDKKIMLSTLFLSLLIYKKIRITSFIVSLIINVYYFYEPNDANSGAEQFLINSMQKIIIIKTILI